MVLLTPLKSFPHGPPLHTHTITTTTLSVPNQSYITRLVVLSQKFPYVTPLSHTTVWQQLNISLLVIIEGFSSNFSGGEKSSKFLWNHKRKGLYFRQTTPKHLCLAKAAQWQLCSRAAPNGKKRYLIEFGGLHYPCFKQQEVVSYRP